MRHVTDICIQEEAIKTANAELVNQHNQLDLSQNYGDGKMSSLDGQCFIVTASSYMQTEYEAIAQAVSSYKFMCSRKTTTISACRSKGRSFCSYPSSSFRKMKEKK